MLYTILLSFMIVVCVLMVLVILAQRSEGGALGIGSGPSGFMTARGAGNFLTRATWILGAAFFGCAIALIIVGNMERKDAILENLKVKPLAPGALSAPARAPAAAPAAPQAPAKPDLGDLEAPASSTPPATSLSAPPTLTAKPATAQPAPAKPKS